MMPAIETQIQLNSLWVDLYVDRVGNTYLKTCIVEMIVKYNSVVSALSINERLFADGLHHFR